MVRVQSWVWGSARTPLQITQVFRVSAKTKMLHVSSELLTGVHFETPESDKKFLVQKLFTGMISIKYYSIVTIVNSLKKFKFRDYD